MKYVTEEHVPNSMTMMSTYDGTTKKLYALAECLKDTTQVNPTANSLIKDSRMWIPILESRTILNSIINAAQEKLDMLDIYEQEQSGETEVD